MAAKTRARLTLLSGLVAVRPAMPAGAHHAPRPFERLFEPPEEPKRVS